EVRSGRTAQMGTDAHTDEQIGFARPVFVFGVFRREARTLGIGVREIRVLFFDAGELGIAAAQDPDRFAAPFDSAHLTRGQIGNVDFDGGARSAGFFGWGKGTN